MTIAGAMTGAGFLFAGLAVFPLGMSDWLPRSLQFATGIVVGCIGLALVEVERMIEEKR